MNQYLGLKKSNCKNCYKCIRHCPVKSIRFSDGQAHIVGDECILCGGCFVVCPQNAKEIRNDVGKAKELIASGAPVYASIAPSFVANYEGADLESMTLALQKLGFAGAGETAIGATVVKKEYDRMLGEGGNSVIISSCCHSINTLIQKYYAEALPFLAHTLSPMQAHCELLKKEHPGAKTVFIGPCISKKAEAEQYPGAVDCVLTFEELSEWLENEKITIAAASSKRDDTGRARLFPTTGGILRSMACENPEYSYLALDGVENCMAALQDVIDGKLDHCFIEMSACVGSCVGGPAMENRRYPVRDRIAVDRYAGRQDFPVEQPEADGLYKELPFVGLHRQMPGSKAIEEILHKMGKATPEQELNCGSCGYNTCREKAVAIYQGKADLSMCLPYLKEKAESFSDNIFRNTPNGLIVVNEELEIQQINTAARKIMNIRSEQDVLGEPVVRILDPKRFLDVLSSGRGIHDERVFLAEYGKYVELSIVYDKSYHILISILRDVTAEEAEREKKEQMSRQTVEITDKVVDKQMRVVQEIASLLGETVAETKIALTNLKESLKDE